MAPFLINSGPPIVTVLDYRPESDRFNEAA